MYGTNTLYITINHWLLTKTWIRKITQRRKHNFLLFTSKAAELRRYPWIPWFHIEFFCSKYYFSAIEELFPLWMTSYVLKHCFWDLTPGKKGALGRTFSSQLVIEFFRFFLVPPMVEPSKNISYKHFFCTKFRTYYYYLVLTLNLFHTWF